MWKVFLHSPDKGFWACLGDLPPDMPRRPETWVSLCILMLKLRGISRSSAILGSDNLQSNNRTVKSINNISIMTKLDQDNFPCTWCIRAVPISLFSRGDHFGICKGMKIAYTAYVRVNKITQLCHVFIQRLVQSIVSSQKGLVIV